MSKTSKDLIPPGLSYLADNIMSKHNILGASKSSRASWAKGLSFSSRHHTIFFAGCGYQYSSQLESLSSLMRRMDNSPIGAELPISLASLPRKVGVDLSWAYQKVLARGSHSDGQPLRDAVKVLSSLGLEFGYLGDGEPCCGGNLWYIGMQDEFASNARNLDAQLKSLGVKHIVGMVPSCTYTLRTLVPECVSGYDIEVKHFVEVVAENLGSRELHFPREVRATYHDPCQLARYLGLVEEPRRLLRLVRGIDLVEVDWTSGEWATCCGGGGGFEAVFPELSLIVAINRVKELLETDPQMIVTHCPGCVMQLEAGLAAIGRTDVEVLDLAQVLALAM